MNNSSAHAQVKAAAREQHLAEAKAKSRPRRKRGKQQEQVGDGAGAAAKKSKNDLPVATAEPSVSAQPVAEPVVPAAAEPSGGAVPAAAPSGSDDKQDGDGNGGKRKGKGAANPDDVLAKWKVKETYVYGWVLFVWVRLFFNNIFLPYMWG